MVSHDEQVRVCVWCSRLQARTGRWVHRSHLVLPDAPFPVTHGICPDGAPALR